MRQPYHAAMGKLETNVATLGRRVRNVRRATQRSIADLIERCTGDDVPDPPVKPSDPAHALQNLAKNNFCATGPRVACDLHQFQEASAEA
jgi:hypothetical protein